MDNKYKLQQCWIWPSTVTEFVKYHISGYSLNVCAGKNPICDVNLDLDPLDKSILKGDMRHLPFLTETFDTVISDPPWKIGYYERMRPFFECIRVCKIGGKIIYNSTWIPESTDVKLNELFARRDAPFATVSIISIFTKLFSNINYENMIAIEKGEKITQKPKFTFN